MKLHIKKNGSIRDIQKEFSEYFPYLKIDFFKLPHTDKKLSPKNEKIDQATPVSRLVHWDNDKVIEISEKMTISQFEAMMDQQTGLFVQVFRNSGRVWIETSYTDDWTLERQNEEGKMMSTINPTSEKQPDWDEWDD
jgi:hypothetical protein